MLLKNCRFLITQNAQRAIFENVDVLIEKDTIKKIGKHLRDEDVIDCSHMIVLPGLINCHTHIGMQSLRGFCDDAELPLWLKSVIAAEKKLTPKKIYDGAKRACREMIASGTTTFVEQYTPIKPVLQAAEEARMRCFLFPAVFSQIGKQKEIIKKTEQYRTSYADHPLITFGFGPHSIYGTSEELLKKIQHLQRDAFVHLHVAETRKERVSCFTQHNLLPVQYLSHLDFLNEKTILAHAVWLTKGELSLIAQAHAKVVNCPTSNMKLAGGGVMPLKEMRALGIVVGLGTDSVVSNNSLDMFSEMKCCALLHKHHYWDPTMASAQQVLDMATRNGAEVLSSEKKIGSIEEGKKADMIALTITDHLLPVTKQNVISSLVYAANGGDVSTVIINGDVVYKEKSFVL